MDEHNFLNEDKMADIETQAIANTAMRLGIDEKLDNEIIQDFMEIIENFERSSNGRYSDGDIITEPYVANEITKKVAKDIADKYNIDEEEVNTVITDYSAMIRESLEKEMLQHPEQEIKKYE